MKLRIRSSDRYDTLWARVIPGPEGRLYRTLWFGMQRELAEHDESDLNTPQPDIAFGGAELMDLEVKPGDTVKDVLSFWTDGVLYCMDVAEGLEFSAPVFELCRIRNTERSQPVSPRGALFLGREKACPGFEALDRKK